MRGRRSYRGRRSSFKRGLKRQKRKNRRYNSYRVARGGIRL